MVSLLSNRCVSILFQHHSLLNLCTVSIMVCGLDIQARSVILSVGVTSLLLNIWTSSAHSKEPWSFRKNLQQFNDQFSLISVPTSTLKPCRTFQTSENSSCYLSNLKQFLAECVDVHHNASELRSFLLIYFVILKGFLPETYFRHHLLLFEAVFILSNKKNISKANIETANDLLQRYVSDFFHLYGRSLVRVIL